MKRNLFSELHRRNVWRAAALYAAVAWLLVQVATQVFPLFDVPTWVVRWIVIAALIGFPFWIAFAWLFELTPEGIRRDSDVDHAASLTQHTRKRLDRWIIALLALAVVLLLINTVVWTNGWRGARATASSIAVLPFANVTSEREQEYFADGISEDLLDLLTKVPGLRVAARTSSFAFKGKEMTVQEIARHLNVANVLQGSVRKAGDEVRITAQLVHAADGYQVWSQSWDRKLDDVFAIQDEIASDVTRELKLKLLAAPVTRQTQPIAYDLYLQGRELGRRLTLESLAQSDSLYRQVLAIDHRYVPAWTGLAHNFASETIIGPCCTTVAGLRRAHDAVDHGLAVDSSYAPAFAAAGMIARMQGDLPAAARYLMRGMSLDPADLDVLHGSALLLEALNRLPQAIAVQKYVVARDPINPIGLADLGRLYLNARRFADAVAEEHAALRLSPGQGVAHYNAGVALLLAGNAAEALAEVQQETDAGWRLVGLSLVYHALGRAADSDHALEQLIADYERDAAFNIAYTYAYRGEADRAFEWLEKAVQYHDSGMSGVAVTATFDGIRADRRWLPFLRRIGQTPEQLNSIVFRARLPQSID